MKALFNDNIKNAILSSIQNANKSIYCAVFRFNDLEIHKALIDALERGISLWMIVSDESDNLDLFQIIEKGGNVFKIDPKKRLLHHKFIVTDRKNLITGSYNWTYNASNNYENAICVQSSELCGDFLDEFESIKKDIDEHVKLLVTNALKEEGIMLQAVEEYSAAVIAYINKYKQSPPAEVLLQLQKKHPQKSNGTDIVIQKPDVPTVTVTVDVEETKKEVDYTAWWNSLPTYWKIHFNNEILERGITTVAPTHWEPLLSAHFIKISQDNNRYPSYGVAFEPGSRLDVLLPFTRLSHLSLIDVGIQNLNDILKFKTLTYLHIGGNPVIDTLKGLETLPFLNELVCDRKFISGFYHIETKRMTDAGFSMKSAYYANFTKP